MANPWYRDPVQWTPEALAHDCGGTLIKGGETPIASAFIDSRNPVPGGLFVPIVAERDGHDFIASAIEGGAAAVLVQRGKTIPSAAVTVVEVEDTLAAFTRLATRRCATFDGPVVTISGSNGKTTTRAMVAAVLGAGFSSVLCTQGNLNNHLGVPLTVLGTPHQPDAMVIELGMSAPGENDALAAIANPLAHVITSVALEHLEFMKTIEAIAAAEAEPVVRVRKGGCVVLPVDEPLLTPHVQGAHADLLRFGGEESCDVQILDVEVGARTKATIRVGPHAPVAVSLQLFGAHNARNAAAALAIGHRFGVPLDAMVQALEAVQPVGDRGRTMSWGDTIVVADCYNSNPGSVEVALQSLAALAVDGPKVAVLGDMLELGPRETELHAAVGQRAAQLGLSSVLAFGPLSAATADAARAAGLDAEHCASIEALHEAVRARFDGVAPGAVLIKGSRGMKLERLLSALMP
ncbi:MAG: UDP-N-acetylmuramoyl-tripeptide--D-alanyl-D-alanine ligase [Myxococcota bacterium]